MKQKVNISLVTTVRHASRCHAILWFGPKLDFSPDCSSVLRYDYGYSGTGTNPKIPFQFSTNTRTKKTNTALADLVDKSLNLDILYWRNRHKVS